MGERQIFVLLSASSIGKQNRKQAQVAAKTNKKPHKIILINCPSTDVYLRLNLDFLNLVRCCPYFGQLNVTLYETVIESLKWLMVDTVWIVFCVTLKKYGILIL